MDFSIFNTDGAVSLFRNLRVMGYHYDSLMEFLAGDFQKLDYLIAGLAVQIAGRFISQDNSWFAG